MENKCHKLSSYYKNVLDLFKDKDAILDETNHDCSCYNYRQLKMINEIYNTKIRLYCKKVQKIEEYLNLLNLNNEKILKTISNDYYSEKYAYYAIAFEVFKDIFKKKNYF